MKNKLFNGSAILMFLAVFSMIAINSCKDPEPEPLPVEDGLYIKGAGTALDSLRGNGLMAKANNEVTQAARASLYEMYIAIEGGSEGFNLVQVVGGVDEMWGPGADFAMVATEDLDGEEPTAGLWKGSYAINETPFTVTEDGLYHVMVDTDLGVMAIAKVEWGLIGGATPGGWTDDTELTESAFDNTTISFTAAEVTMNKEAWKFRYSGGWKVILDTIVDNGEGKLGVKVNTNFGTDVDALVAGGDNISNDVRAIYAFDITWTLGSGTTASMTYVKDAEALPYPATLNMVGGSIGGWDWGVNGIEMIAVNSQPHLFWKIVYLEQNGIGDPGLKFSETGTWDDAHGVDAGSGVAGVYGTGGDNVPDVAASGLYMVVVNYFDETVEISDAPMIYGIGDAFGSWDAAQAATLFTLDHVAKTATSTAVTVDGNLRMHTAASTLTTEAGAAIEWWQAEFNVIGGNIEYRGAGGDQAAVAVTVGQTAVLNFGDGTGAIQ